MMACWESREEERREGRERGRERDKILLQLSLSSVFDLSRAKYHLSSSEQEEKEGAGRGSATSRGHYHPGVVQGQQL